MAKQIKGKGGGRNGGNASYTIPGRGTVPRRQLVREVKQGKHPNFGTVKVNGETYVRGLPDTSKGNNVNDE
jgi:hypothetical protein